MYAAGQPESAITRVVSAFKDCLSDTEVLRTIDDFFGDLGFEFDPEAEERNRAQGVGQRRSRAAGYLETLNLSQDTGRDMLAAAVGTKLAEWDDKHGPSPDRLTRLHRTLKTAGFEWNGSDLVPRTPTKDAAATKPAAAAPVAQAEPVPDVPSVFISYAHEDQAVAQGLAHALLARGSRVWIDVEMIRIGDDLADRIGKAIESVDFLLAIISEESVKSRWCKRELGIAFDAAMKTDRVKVLPLRLGSVSLPPILRGLYSPRVDPANVEAMADKILADMKAHRGDDDYGTPAAKRPDPPPSDPTDTLPAAPTSPPKVDPEEPIRIIGIDEEGVTRPRNDGSAGSGLYVVPLRLNRKP